MALWQQKGECPVAARWSLLTIGTNRIINTSGVLTVMGHPQIKLERRRDGQLLLTMDIYDSTGSHVARLRRNAWVFNLGNEYAITTNPANLSLTHTPSRDVLVEVSVKSTSEIHIVQAKFYTSTGMLIEATKEYLKVGQVITLIQTQLDALSAAISISAAGIGIG
jgi:hypothetical protein